ncbi:RrF2 family transcriptional regulator [Pyruvatibacter mobilis]|uniref:RrF2 family transcriptional regulator n=1 Tax=Pyruvatibacter mobilis TaxID=1712261 RepID=UPI0019634D0D|nr:Rrf2 family transcriptional regulator [Pyruvatibacter mobilis]GGD22377.1 Rrf2 family transcriptional regulator [Pyruvatibacter mobilis]
MLRLSKKTLLALEAVVDVAYNARPDPVQSKEITKRQGIPQRYLEQVMQQLVREGVLKGVRGPRGGYRLARERRRITVGEIVRIVGAMEAADDARDEAKQAAREARSAGMSANGASNGAASGTGHNSGDVPASNGGNGSAGGSPLGEQVVRPMWDAFQAEMMEKLEAITIEDLCREAETKNIRPAQQVGMDFTI